MQGPASPIAPPRFSVSMLPVDADPAERDFVKLLERALAPSFTLVRRLGAGGMGSVYLARDPVLKRLVAVKVMAPGLAADAAARARFEREAQAVASISHPNVVAVYSVGALENGVPYLVMQYVEGRTMADRIAEGGPLDAPTARRVLGEVSSALAAAHRKGVIHRDIKPSNILWDDESGRALVTDFGIAAVKQRGEPQPADEKLTQTGMSLGTPAYMSPEQVLAEPVTEKTDVYTLGLLGYELLTGTGPYQVASPRELMAAHLRDTPRKLSSVRADVDAELERLLEECLAKDAAKRPTAEEVEGRLLHGASILLEWPPPGLEPLRGAFERAVRVLGLGSTLVGVPLVLLSVFDSRSPVRQLLPPTEFVLSIATLGVLVFIAGVYYAERFFRVAARAADTGYRWGTIFEVAADSRGDTGALITGAREYATLSPAQRSAFRRARLSGALLQLVAAITPVLGYAVGVLVASRVSAGPTIVLWSSLALASIMLGATGALRTYENRVLGAPRNRRLALSSVRERPTELAAQWTETFEYVRDGQAMGPGFAGRKRAVLRTAFVTLGLSAGTVLVGYLLIVFGSVIQVYGAQAMPNFQATRERFTRVARLRAYVVPRDSSISPLRAGQALHAVSRAGGAAGGGRWESAPAIAIRAHSPPDAPPPFGDGSTIVDAFRVAPRGFTDTQRRYLLRLAENPALAEFRLVANARHLDIGAAMWNVPPGSRLSPRYLPLMRFGGIRNAARSNTAQAALDLAAGQPRDAERRLREVISVGFLMMDDAKFLLENLVGAALVNNARLALEAFYQATGRPAEARFVSAASDPQPDLRIESGGRARPSIEEVMRAQREIVLDSTEINGLRWEMLVAYAITPCMDPRQIIFGPDSLHVAMIRDAERQLVRSASDSVLFSLVEQPLDDRHMTRNGVPLATYPRTVLGWTVSAVTGHAVFAACSGLMVGDVQ